MNVLSFLKGIKDGLGLDCIVSVILADNILSVDCTWKNFHYRYAVSILQVESFVSLDNFFSIMKDYIIEDATKKFSMAEVGEE